MSNAGLNQSFVDVQTNNTSSNSCIVITPINRVDERQNPNLINLDEISNYQTQEQPIECQKARKQDLISDLVRNSVKTKCIPVENGKYLRDWRRRVIKLVGSYILINKYV